MDHPFSSDRPFQPLPPTLAAIGARIVSFLHAGGRTGVLVGPPGSGKTRVLDAVVAGMPGRVMRVSNRHPSVLTMGRLLAQLGAPEDAGSAADDGRALLAHLAASAGETDAAVLVVDDAHTLSPAALSALARVPGLGGPDLPGMIVLLAGEDELLMRLGPLRDSRMTVVVSMADGPGLVRTPGPEPDGSSDLDPPPAHEPRAALRSRFHIVAVLAAIVAGAAAFGGGLWLALWPLHPAPPPRTVEALSPPAASLTNGTPLDMADLAPRTATVASAGPGLQQLRRDFDAFLARSGETAHLTLSAREALFAEYVAWQARSTRRGS